MGKIVRGGTVIDGTGAPPTQVDIRIEKGRIIEMGDIKKSKSKESSTHQLLIRPAFSAWTA